MQVSMHHVCNNYGNWNKISLHFMWCNYTSLDHTIHLDTKSKSYIKTQQSLHIVCISNNHEYMNIHRGDCGDILLSNINCEELFPLKSCLSSVVCSCFVNME
eukprot:330718_1